MKPLYVDHNATSPLHPAVADFLREGLLENAGNPSSTHGAGRAARIRLDRARARVAARLGCEPKEIVFTASGSEANALALHGAFRGRHVASRARIVTSTIEHPALLSAAEVLKREGATFELVPPLSTGAVSEGAVLEALEADTLICSLMWANNETGVLQPVNSVARLCRERGILFHTDAVQALGKVPVTLQHVDADLLSLSAHKFGGPQGVGILVVRNDVTLAPLVPGHQEGGRRGGTQNLLFAEACALALELACDAVEAEAARLAALRDRFEGALRARFSDVIVNGGEVPRLANTSSVRFGEMDGEALLIGLDLEGVHASMGAACASGTLKPSHVLTAMELTDAQARASLRFSFGSELDEAGVDRLVACVSRVRAMAG